MDVMKRLFSATYGALAALSMLAPLGAATAAGPVVTQAEDGRTIRLPRGETLTLRLESNGTTGYQWEVAALPRNLKRVGDTYEALGQGRGRSAVAGAGGVQILTFKRAATGRGTLRLVYRQPWDREARPEGRFQLVVVAQ
jgi:inhibitor of cysteine peptidase